MDRDIPDPRHLQLFDLIYQYGSVTRAATRLGLSQPTASIWLGQLREQLGDPLFVRTPGGMAPTPRADSLIGPCREVLESLRRFAGWEHTFDPATAQRKFRICMTDASHITLLPALLTHVRSHAPGVQLVAARIDPHTEHALQTGQADVAIGYVPWLTDNIRKQELFPQDWVCLAGRRHPRVRARLGVDGYRAEGHVAVPAGTGGHLLEQALTRERIDRRVVLELSGFLGLGVVIRTTDLLVTLPRHTGEALAATNRLAVHDCPFPVDGFVVAQHWHPRYHHEPGNRWLRGVIAGLFTAGRRTRGSASVTLPGDPDRDDSAVVTSPDVRQPPARR